MEHKPDIIKTLLLAFAVGLLVTGFTSLQATEDSSSEALTAVPAVTGPIAVSEVAD